jgi:membrane-bound lytic murein transglycosylase D
MEPSLLLKKRKIALFYILSFVSCLLLGQPVFASLPGEIHTIHEYHFSVPPGLQHRVDFWKSIYSKYTTNQVVLHDIDNLDIVYEVVYMGKKKLSWKQRERKLRSVKAKYKGILRKLSKTGKDWSKLNSEELRVAKLVKRNFSKAARNMRGQLGQKDRFREGLIQSGLYMDQIKKIFKSFGLPEELTVLPHVESSFQIGAYSSAGAAGIWQFTRSTGRLFLNIGYQVDERRDPILATYAAAKLLKLNYEHLDNWPLAITAYNHGLQGMKNAKKRHGGSISAIIRKYKSRSFGFASSNFYAEFLAAKEVAGNYKKYFPGVVMAKPIKLNSVRFGSYVNINTIINKIGMTREEIAKYNPSLRRPVLSGKRRIPKNFLFQAPAAKYSNLSSLYNSIPSPVKFKNQVQAKWHTVRRGESLSSIATRYRTSVGKLMRVNNISNKHRIYKGQVLELPDKAKIYSNKVPSKLANTKGGKKQFKGETGIYRVRKNDNLTVIAKRIGVDVNELKRLNRMRNPNALYLGQRLRVPKNEETKKEALPVKKKEVVKTPPQESEAVYSDVNNSAVGLNTNRPAFTPVSFSSSMLKEQKIGFIKVDFDETLSHYAECAGLSLKELRRLNGIRRSSSSLSLNRKIKIPFSQITPEEFANRRQEYHKAVQEDFFNSYKVEKILIRNVKKGETLWILCNKVYDIPIWLLGNYNPDKDMTSLSEGDPIIIPILIPTTDA